MLHYVDGLTLEEVARQTDLSVSGVRKRLRKLRHIADGDGDGDRSMTAHDRSRSRI